MARVKVGEHLLLDSDEDLAEVDPTEFFALSRSGFAHSDFSLAYLSEFRMHKGI